MRRRSPASDLSGLERGGNAVRRHTCLMCVSRYIGAIAVRARNPRSANTQIGSRACDPRARMFTIHVHTHLSFIVLEYRRNRL